jgi:hypothetical protein
LKGVEGTVHDAIAVKKHEARLIHRAIITNNRVEDTGGHQG